jgi:hypothetical protein
MATVDRRGKSVAPAVHSVSLMPLEDYDSAYALWKMGTPVKQLAEQYNVNDMVLDYSFELRLIHESKE